MSIHVPFMEYRITALAASSFCRTNIWVAQTKQTGWIAYAEPARSYKRRIISITHLTSVNERGMNELRLTGLTVSTHFLSISNTIPAKQDSASNDLENTSCDAPRSMLSSCINSDGGKKCYHDSDSCDAEGIVIILWNRECLGGLHPQ